MVHRKGHRKSHRKSHRKGSRRSAHRRRSHRRQYGGASCAAQPLFNREMFSQQGGMAPITEDGFLLDGPSRVQAQVSSLDTAFSQLPQVIPRQSGGRRRRSARKGRRSARKSHRRHRSRRHRRHHKGSRSAQRGGAHQLAGYTDSYMTGVDIAKSGSNPQFLEYLPAKGAQQPTA